MAAALRERTPDGEVAERCDLAVVAVTSEHAEELAAVAAAVEDRLEPGVLIGAVAAGVVGDGEEVDDGPGVSVFALAAPGGYVSPLRCWTMRPRGGGVHVAGWPDTRPGDVVLLLAAPGDVPVSQLAERMGRERPGQPIIGGLVAGRDGQSRLLVDGRLHTGGAVGAVLRDVPLTPVVSVACRAIGRPVTVTGVEGDRLLSLAGTSATDHLDEVLRGLDTADLALLEQGGLQIGTVVDELADEYEPGGMQLRGVLAIDPDDGSITVGDHIPLGAVVRFHVRDPVHAGADLAARLRAVAPDQVAGALLFTCLGRGRSLFGSPHHDAQAVASTWGTEVAGLRCDGELGPLGGRSALHGYAVVVLGVGPGVTER